MRSFLAALRTLVLPYGKTSGQRIVLDGVNGEIDVYDNTDQKAVAIGPGPVVLVTGAGVIDILDPATNKDASLMVRGGSGNTPEIMLSGSGTFASGSISMFLQMDDQNDQVFRMFMGRRGQDDQRAAINQWDISATRAYFAMDGYAGDFATSTHGWMFQPNAPGALVARVGGVEETWHNIALQNGWAARGATWPTPGYRLMPDGTVALRGQMAGGVTADGTLIGTLPVGYRPPTEDNYVISSYVGSNDAILAVKTDGTMYIFNVGGAPLTVGLGGVRIPLI